MNKKILLILLVAIIILGLIGYYIYTIYSVKPIFDPEADINNSQGFFNANVSPEIQDNNTNVPAVDVPGDDKVKIEFLGKIFSQNFGSYSNQRSLTNFDDIYSLMGANMKKWIEETYKAQILKDHPADVYYAIETKVLSVRAVEISEANNSARVMVKTQRSEYSINPTNQNVFNQDLLLNIIKVNGDWIVDSAYWQ